MKTKTKSTLVKICHEFFAYAMVLHIQGNIDAKTERTTKVHQSTTIPWHY